jgi:hypothetical protein
MWQRIGERPQAQPRVGLQRDTTRLGRVERVYVKGDQPSLGKERVRSGGKVRQPRAHGKDQISFTSQCIGRGRAGDTD